jgi:hypothetical protein
MKAWEVRDLNYAAVVLVFAETRSKAHRRGVAELDEEWTRVRTRRAPAFDDLAPGPVTPQDYLARGWWIYCGCGAAVFDDAAVLDEHGGAFCLGRCRGRTTDETTP